MELVHVSIALNEDDIIVQSPLNSNTTRNLPQISYPCIQGLKIIGDENVPAERLTFIFSLMPENNSQVSHNHPRWSSGERLSRIHLQYDGFLQVNYYPNNPQYEWDRCSFVLYHPSNDSDEPVFSILWLRMTDFRCVSRYIVYMYMCTYPTY